MSSEDALVCLVGADNEPGTGTTATGATRSVARSGVPDGGEAAVLGNNADFASAVPAQELAKVSPAIDIHAVLPPPSAIRGFFLRRIGADLLRGCSIRRRMGDCGARIAKRRHNGGDGVNIYARPGASYGRVWGVCVCAQSITCPVCAPRLAAFRAEEVAAAFRAAEGFNTHFETFTIPHVLDLSPNALYEQIRFFSRLWRLYGGGRKLEDREPGRVGSHVAREVTWGDNGWHYHFHRLRYDERDKHYRSDLARVDWHQLLRDAGLWKRGAEERSYTVYGVLPHQGAEAVARYCAKINDAVAAELVSSATKEGRSSNRNLMQLLADYAFRGDLQAGSVWVNGVAAVTALKVSAVRWSPGLADRLGIVRERSDTEIASETAQPSDVFLGSLNPAQWSRVLSLKAEFALLVAANNGREAVDEMLVGLGVGKLNEDEISMGEAREREREALSLRQLNLQRGERTAARRDRFRDIAV